MVKTSGSESENVGSIPAPATIFLRGDYMKTKYLSLLLAVVLCFGLAAPAFANFDYSYISPNNAADNGFGSGGVSGANQQNVFYSAQAENIYSIALLLMRSLAASKNSSYLWDQGFDGQIVPMQYAAYALHALKGTFKNQGDVVGIAPDNGSGANIIYSKDVDYFLSTWVGFRPEVTSTDKNRWRVQTLSDNDSGSWLYQMVHNTAQSGLTMEALMNWSNPDYMFVPSATAPYSWFNSVSTSLTQQNNGISSILTQLRNSNMDTSGLATEATLSAVRDSTLSIESALVDGTNEILSEMDGNLLGIWDAFVGDKYNYSNYTMNSDGSLLQGAGSGVNFPKATNNNLRSMCLELFAINSNILKLDEILATENDRALEDATDDTKVTVKDYVSDKKSNFGDSFIVGSTVTDGLKSDLSTAQASSAVSGLFSPDSGDYWGWFSSDTDSNLHPGASSTATVSLDSELSAQDVADSETVWVINPYASSSDLISDFFGGE